MASSGATTQTAQAAPMLQNLFRDKYNLAVSWEAPLFSGLVLVAINFTFIAYRVVDLSVLTLSLYAAGIALVCGCVYSNTILSATAAQQVSENAMELINAETAARIADQIRTNSNKMATVSRKLLYWTAPKNSVITLAIVIASAWIISRVSLAVLLLTACDAIILQQPAMKLYRKHAEPILLPYTQIAAEKLRAVLRNIPCMEGAAARHKRL